MATLTDADIKRPSQREYITSLEDTDVFVVEDVSEQKIKPITKTNAKATLGITSAEGTLADHETRLDTLEADSATEGSVAKTVKDNAKDATYDNSTSELTAETLGGAIDELDGKIDTAEGDIDTLEGRVDTTELTLARHDQDLASVKQTLQQGNGATLDFSGIGIVPLDARATGRANPTVEGLTATNLVENGDFSAGTTGWSVYGSTHSVTDKVLSNTGNGNSSVPHELQSTGKSYKNGDVVYIPIKVRVTNAVCTSIAVALFDGSTYIANIITQSTPVDSTWYILSVRYTFLADVASLNIRIRHIYADAGTSLNKVLQIDGNYGVMAINLTQTFGAGNEPSASDCAKIFSNYFYGTKSIQMPARVRSVGKNLFDEASAKIYSNFSVFEPASNGYFSFPIQLKPTTEYTFSRADNEGLGEDVYALIDVNNKTTNSTTYMFIHNTVTSLNKQKVSFITNETGLVFFTVGALRNAEKLQKAWDIIKYAQIELGSTATTYEPYSDSTLYIADNEEVRSVQAVSDAVSVVNGEHMLTKKISTPVSVASGVAVNVTNYPTAKTGGKFAVELTAGGTQIGIIGTDSTSGAGMLRYELATPVVTKLLTSGILQAKPKGTVYFEPYYEGSHQTNASSQITLPYEGTIDKLTGYDENLEPYEVPSTGYTLVGTTLTVTGAEENEVFYVELSRTEPLAPEMGVNVINNEQVTLDTVNGKYYKITHTTANGVPTTVATEVV